MSAAKLRAVANLEIRVICMQLLYDETGLRFRIVKTDGSGTDQVSMKDIIASHGLEKIWPTGVSNLANPTFTQRQRLKMGLPLGPDIPCCWRRLMFV